MSAEYEATLFHGTTKRFHRFDRAYLSSGCGGMDTIYGFYLTDQQDAARWFALQQPGEAFVLAVRVKLLKPLQCHHTGLQSATAGVLADGARVRGHDGIIFHCGPLGSMFVCVFDPDYLRVVGRAKVREASDERARQR